MVIIKRCAGHGGHTQRIHHCGPNSWLRLPPSMTISKIGSLSTSPPSNNPKSRYYSLNSFRLFIFLFFSSSFLSLFLSLFFIPLHGVMFFFFLHFYLCVLFLIFKNEVTGEGREYLRNAPHLVCGISERRMVA